MRRTVRPRRKRNGIRRVKSWAVRVDGHARVPTLGVMGANTDVSRRLNAVGVLVAVYAAGMVGTLVALGILAAAAPGQATQEAWGHAVIVTVLAFLLLLRLRSARAGSVRAVRALGVVAGVLLVANVVEASLPGTFPGWMRVEMVAVALLMAALLGVMWRQGVLGAGSEVAADV
jgi:hypothetical protein